MLIQIGIAAMFFAGTEHFEKKIQPVLAAQCYGCHSSAVAVPKAGLLLDSAVGLRRAVPLLPAALRKMPPGKPLAPEIVADFERWIADGAPLPENKQELWSLQKPRATTGSIDQFIADGLKAKGLTMS